MSEPLRITINGKHYLGTHITRQAAQYDADKGVTTYTLHVSMVDDTFRTLLENAQKLQQAGVSIPRRVLNDCLGIPEPVDPGEATGTVQHFDDRGPVDPAHPRPTWNDRPVGEAVADVIEDRMWQEPTPPPHHFISYEDWWKKALGAMTPQERFDLLYMCKPLTPPPAVCADPTCPACKGKAYQRKLGLVPPVQAIASQDTPQYAPVSFNSVDTPLPCPSAGEFDIQHTPKGELRTMRTPPPETFTSILNNSARKYVFDEKEYAKIVSEKSLEMKADPVIAEAFDSRRFAAQISEHMKRNGHWRQETAQSDPVYVPPVVLQAALRGELGPVIDYDPLRQTINGVPEELVVGLLDAIPDGNEWKAELSEAAKGMKAEDWEKIVADIDEPPPTVGYPDVKPGYPNVYIPGFDPALAKAATLEIGIIDPDDDGLDGSGVVDEPVTSWRDRTPLL